MLTVRRVRVFFKTVAGRELQMLTLHYLSIMPTTAGYNCEVNGTCLKKNPAGSSLESTTGLSRN